MQLHDKDNHFPTTKITLSNQILTLHKCCGASYTLTAQLSQTICLS